MLPLPTAQELADPVFLAWNAKLCAAPRTVDSHRHFAANKPATGAAYDYALAGFAGSLPMSEYGALVIGRFDPALKIP